MLAQFICELPCATLEIPNNVTNLCDLIGASLNSQAAQDWIGRDQVTAKQFYNALARGWDADNFTHDLHQFLVGEGLLLMLKRERYRASFGEGYLMARIFVQLYNYPLTAQDHSQGVSRT